MELKFGKRPPLVDSRTIRLSSIIKRELLPPLPNSYDNHEVLGVVDNFVFRNAGKDALGNCVKAARAHQALVFEAFEQGKQIKITDQEVVDEYFAETGGADSGLILLLSLKDWKNDGWLVSGKNYTIYAFASVDWRNHDEVRHCIHLLGGVNFGMLVYEKDIEQFRNGEVWHLTGNDGSRLSGHGVYLYAYDDKGVTCMTWGKSQKMTWPFWDARIDEAYGIVDDRDKWIGEDSPLDVEKNDAYLEEITGQAADEPPGCFPPVLGTIVQKLRALHRTVKVRLK